MTLFGRRQQAAFKRIVAKTKAERKNIFRVVDLELVGSTYQQKDEVLTRS